jgi:hypothetical protein
MSERMVVYVPVVPVVDLETEKALNIPRDQIAKITTERIAKRDTLVFTTLDGKRYRRAETQDEYEEAWYDGGFRRTDITNVVNLSRGKVLDEAHGVLYFGHKLDANAVRGFIARPNMDHVREKMSKYGIITKKELESREAALKKIEESKITISFLQDPAPGIL